MIATIQSAARLLSLSLLTLVAQVHTAEAFPAFGDDWKLVYPLSMSAANTETGVGTTVCQLCHANALGGVPWNGYGFDLRLARTDPGCDLNADSFVSVEEGLLCIEKLNSDGDSPGFSNIDEIKHSFC